ncbi:unnamed protein product [Musa hybrid cultivar]
MKGTVLMEGPSPALWVISRINCAIYITRLSWLALHNAIDHEGKWRLRVISCVITVVSNSIFPGIRLQKIVLKVCIMCNKCKICIMTTIAHFEGVVSIALDAEKNTVTIVGNVDATLIVKALRKARKTADIVSVGEASRYRPVTVELCTTSQSHCSSCRPVMVVCEETKGCSIL